MENKFIFIVNESNCDLRIDKTLALLMDSLSRSFIQKLIKNGNVTVNDKIVKASYVTSVDDEISFVLPPASQPEIPAQDIPLDILYEDSDIIVVNKPKDMVVHPSAGHYSDTLVNALMFHCKDNLSGINGVMRPGIVHRIDKDTTGSVIVCKNDFSHTSIAAQLKEHSITRKYIAIVHGVLKQEQGKIHTNIGRSTTDRKKMAVVNGSGKEAITHYRVLKQYKKYAYVECQLETGRTHQIRVHMAHIGHPLLGDAVYGTVSKEYKHLQGQCLHALILGFMHPRTNEYIETYAPVPSYFQHLLDIMEV